MAWTFKQANNNDAGSGTSISTSFSSVITTGSIWIGWVEWSPNQASDPISSITDDKGNSYPTPIGFLNDATQAEGVALFWSGGNSYGSGLPTTITVNFGSTSMSFSNMIIAEFAPSAGALATDGGFHGLFTTNVANAGGFNSGNITTVNNGDLIFGVAANNTNVSSAGSGYTAISTSSGNNLAEYQVQSAAGAISATFVNNTGGVAEVNAAVCAISITSAAVIDVPTNYKPKIFPVIWNLNTSLLRGRAVDESSLGVETNPHWRSRTFPSQWSPTVGLRQNAAVDVPPVVTPDTPPPFKPSTFPAQWFLDRRLFQTTAQDFSSFGVETNPHWYGRSWPIQWFPTAKLRQNDPQDTPGPQLVANPHWFGKPWLVQWAPLSLLRATPNDAPAPATPETNTFFVPRTFPLQWLLQPSLRQTTAQDFSFLGIATSVHLIPRTWPPQWNLQASLMRGTAQDFSSLPPATNPVYARYGAAHGIGMLSAIPGEIPS